MIHLGRLRSLLHSSRIPFLSRGSFFMDHEVRAQRLEECTHFWQSLALISFKIKL